MCVSKMEMIDWHGMSPCMEISYDIPLLSACRCSSWSVPVGNGNRRRPLVPRSSHLHSRPSLAMLTVLSAVFSLFGLFFVQLLLGLRRAARDVGSVRPRPRNNWFKLIHFRVALQQPLWPILPFPPTFSSRICDWTYVLEDSLSKCGKFVGPQWET
jgi:hypothetical protein